MASLDLPDDARTLVWRALVARMQDDTTLAKCIKTWRIPNGKDPNVWATITDDAQAPALRLVPRMEPLTWYSAESMKAPLTVDFEAFVRGDDAEDVMNLQGAVERSLYPVLDGNAFQLALVGSGAETGLIEFTHPLDQPAGDREGGWHALGAIRVEVVREIIL